MSRKLTPKQAAFVQEYLKDLNATQACIRAGYSKNGADVTGSQLLVNPRIRVALETALKDREARTQITQDRVLREFARIAFLDPRKLFSDDGSPLRITDLDDDTAAAVIGLDVATIGNGDVGIGEVQKIKLADKVQALTQVGRHLGMFNDKLNVGGQADNPLKLLLSEISGKSIGPK